jgi:hypothetical protein
VIYQPGSGPMGGHVGRDLAATLTPFLDTTGKPIPADASATPTSWGLTPYLSHSGGGVTTYGGIEWRRVLAIDHADAIEAKHTITNSTLGEFVQHTQGTVTDWTDPATYPVTVTDSACVGRMYVHTQSQVHYDRCLFDRDDCGRSDLSTGLANGGASNQLNVSLRRCTSILGDYNSEPIVNVGANDFVRILDSRFYLQGTTAARALIEVDNTDTPDQIDFQRNTVDSDANTTHAVFRGVDMTDAAAAAVYFSALGGNAYGTGLNAITFNNTASVTRDLTWWNANLAPSPADVQEALPWGTDPANVLRALWINDAFRRTNFTSANQ